MAAAWSRGKEITAEALLARFPATSDECAIRLIYEEVCLRRESGEKVGTTEVVRRFPQWKDELEVLLGCDSLLRPLCSVALFPEPGTQLGPFRLVEELGRGASGRTYLAVETGLADRLVALKVIPDDQDEHLSLARLQHTHIIPLFSEHTFPEQGLRALCMPYLGGTSLARILEELRDVPLAERTGRQLLDVLDRAATDRAITPTGDRPYRLYLEQATYIEAVCWIGICLAKALHVAHQHGLVHMDVKPSNVLMAADGQPMLLDFHLARKRVGGGEGVLDRLGGTPDWMAPEHRAALEATRVGRPVPQPVDGSADQYALGLLLREALVGTGAGRDPKAGIPWQRRNPGVSAGLTDIVAKCLAEDAAQRYSDADALAGDLSRHLSDLPLRGVPNRSLGERWRKWRRRRPAALAQGITWITVLLAGSAIAVLGSEFYGQRMREIETALDDGTRLVSSERFGEAVHILSRGLRRARSLPAVERIARALSRELSRAQRGQKARELHQLADLIRYRYGLEPPAAIEARFLIREIEAVWNERGILLTPRSQPLEPAIEAAIRADFVEMIVLWVGLRTRPRASADSEAARQDALRLLDEAEASCGTSPALESCRLTLAGEPARSLARSDTAAEPTTTQHNYDLGRSYLRAARFREASAEFQRVLEQRPQDFWSHFYQGVCAYRLRQFSDALGAFRTCIALEPMSSECYHNRALAAEALGRVPEAFRDYSRALELDPRNPAAALNRGTLFYKSGCYDQAIVDFEQALRELTDPETIGRTHYNLALAYLASGKPAAALRSAEAALAQGHDAANALLDRLRQPD
jgi:serine/threonine protein kinase/tetratricopeptide (TPR) repeat protein